MNTISTIDGLIETLGGPTKAGLFFGEKTNVVGNWQSRGKMPAHKFLEHQAKLMSHGISAPPSLWFSKSEERA